MSPKLFNLLFRAALFSVVLILGSGGWYYFGGRHPRVIVSQAITQKEEEPACLQVGPGEVVIVAGDTARLFDTKSGKEKWSANLSAAGAAATSVAAASPAPSTDPRVAK